MKFGQKKTRFKVANDVLDSLNYSEGGMFNAPITPITSLSSSCASEFLFAFQLLSLLCLISAIEYSTFIPVVLNSLNYHGNTGWKVSSTDYCLVVPETYF